MRGRGAALMNNVAIIGAGLHPFGRFDGKSAKIGRAHV